jgi:hypothetical protein
MSMATHTFKVVVVDESQEPPRAIFGEYKFKGSEYQGKEWMRDKLEADYPETKGFKWYTMTRITPRRQPNRVLMSTSEAYKYQPPT